MHHELKKNFLTVYQQWELMSRNGQPITKVCLIELLKVAIDFSGREVLRKSPEIYLLMPEHWIAELLYFAFERIVGANQGDIDTHIKNAIYLYSWNFLKNDQFRKVIPIAIGKKAVNEMLPSAQTCIDRIGIMPALLATMQLRAQEPAQ